MNYLVLVEKMLNGLVTDGTQRWTKTAFHNSINTIFYYKSKKHTLEQLKVQKNQS